MGKSGKMLIYYIAQRYCSSAVKVSWHLPLLPAPLPNLVCTRGLNPDRNSKHLHRLLTTTLNIWVNTVIYTWLQLCWKHLVLTDKFLYICDFSIREMSACRPCSSTWRGQSKTTQKNKGENSVWGLMKLLDEQENLSKCIPCRYFSYIYIMEGGRLCKQWQDSVAYKSDSPVLTAEVQ